MKKTALFTALIAAAGVATTAQAAPTVYGKVDASLQADLNHIDTKGKETTSLDLQSNNAKFGVKGSEKLSNGMKAIYKLEVKGYLVQQSKSKTLNEFAAGDRFIGIDGGAGELKIGVFDSPTKAAKKDADLAHNVGGISEANELKGTRTVQYTTPDLGGVKAAIAVIPHAKANAAGSENGDMDISASVAFEQDGIYVAAAFDNGLRGDYVQAANAKKTTGIRLATQLNMIENLQIGGVFDSAKVKDGAEVMAVLASVKYDIDTISPRAQVTYQKVKDVNTVTGLLLGADYALGENVTAYTDLGYSSDKPESGDAVNSTKIDVGLEVAF